MQRLSMEPYEHVKDDHRLWCSSATVLGQQSGLQRGQQSNRAALPQFSADVPALQADADTGASALCAADSSEAQLPGANPTSEALAAGDEQVGSQRHRTAMSGHPLEDQHLQMRSPAEDAGCDFGSCFGISAVILQLVMADWMGRLDMRRSGLDHCCDVRGWDVDDYAAGLAYGCRWSLADRLGGCQPGDSASASLA